MFLVMPVETCGETTLSPRKHEKSPCGKACGKPAESCVSRAGMLAHALSDCGAQVLPDYRFTYSVVALCAFTTRSGGGTLDTNRARA